MILFKKYILFNKIVKSFKKIGYKPSTSSFNSIRYDGSVASS
jgi:hypothetical protein